MLTIDPIRRIDDQTIIKYSRKFTVPLPDPFIEANNLQPQDEMEIYRERVNGRDALILIPKKSVEYENNTKRTDSDRKENAAAIAETEVLR